MFTHFPLSPFPSFKRTSKTPVAFEEQTRPNLQNCHLIVCPCLSQGWIHSSKDYDVSLNHLACLHLQFRFSTEVLSDSPGGVPDDQQNSHQHQTVVESWICDLRPLNWGNFEPQKLVLCFLTDHYRDYHLKRHMICRTSAHELVLDRNPVIHRWRFILLTNILLFLTTCHHLYFMYWEFLTAKMKDVIQSIRYIILE